MMKPFVYILSMLLLLAACSKVPSKNAAEFSDETQPEVPYDARIDSLWFDTLKMNPKSFFGGYEKLVRVEFKNKSYARILSHFIDTLDIKNDERPVIYLNDERLTFGLSSCYYSRGAFGYVYLNATPIPVYAQRASTNLFESTERDSLVLEIMEITIPDGIREFYFDYTPDSLIFTHSIEEW